MGLYYKDTCGHFQCIAGGGVKVSQQKQHRKLYLMKDRIVRCVDLISPVDITHTEESGNSLLNELALVGRGVCTQYLMCTDKVIFDNENSTTTK